MSGREIWGMEPKEFHEFLGDAEIGAGLLLIIAAGAFASSGIGFCGAIPAGIFGIGLIAKGVKERANAAFNPKYK